MRRIFLLAALGASLMSAAQTSVETQRQYLSGHGCDDMVEWDFFCTDGRNAGKWTKICVPSCWELQGFGTYQYGMRFYGKATPEGIADEQGKYKTEFTLPQEWAGRQILLVFEAAFTEIRVQINGRKAGNGTYQGGFTRHTIDVSDRVFFGKKKNRLEVEVLKESTIPQVNLAERRADYWNFGGIWRPVFIVSKPAQNIQRVAIDAKADGHFMADVFLNLAEPEKFITEAAIVSILLIDEEKTYKLKGGRAKKLMKLSSQNPDSEFLSLFGNHLIKKYKKIDKSVKKAALIIDNTNGSNTEAMVSEIKATSCRTTIYGRDNTSGCLDFSNLAFIHFKHFDCYFGVPMSRRIGLPETSIDKNGIAPDVRIDLPLPAKLTDNIDEWVIWVADQLEK